jgi:hypothetical protein
MSILQKLGTAIKMRFGQSKEPTLDKTELLNRIEALLQTATVVKETLNKSEVAEMLAILHQTGVKTLSSDIVQLQKIYRGYFEELSPRNQQAERDRVFSTAALAVDEIDRDLIKLREHFAELFDGVDQAEIAVGAMTVTMAAVIGWLNQVDQYFSWLTYFIGNLGTTSRVPPYQLQYVEQHLAAFVAMTDRLVDRPTSQSILTMLETVRRSGADVRLETDGHTVDSYAADSHYSQAFLQTLNGFTIRNPIMMIGSQINVRRQIAYDRDKAQREWLASRVGFLTLKAHGLDPESPEAKKLQAVIERYAELVAKYDHQLGVRGDGY